MVPRVRPDRLEAARSPRNATRAARPSREPRRSSAPVRSRTVQMAPKVPLDHLGAGQSPATNRESPRLPRLPRRSDVRGREQVAASVYEPNWSENLCSSFKRSFHFEHRNDRVSRFSSLVSGSLIGARSALPLLVNQLWDWAPGRTGICCVRLEARRSPADTFLAISPVPTHFLFGLGPTYLLG